MILVTGATGNVGSAVIAELVAAGAPVRAFVRDAGAAAARFGPEVEQAAGDFGDRASLARALQGVEAVFLSSADGPDKATQEIAVIEEAIAAGVGKIAKCSTINAETGSVLPPFDWHGRIEDRLRASGLPSVVLRSAFYMTNLLASAEAVRHTGTLFAPAGGAKIAMLDPRDVGAVAAVALTTPDHDGATLELTGPETVTYDDVAVALSAATGRPIQFVDIPDEAARDALTAAGMPPWLIRHLGGLFPLLRQGMFDQPTETVRAITGRPARSMEAFAADYADAFRA